MVPTFSGGQPRPPRQRPGRPSATAIRSIGKSARSRSPRRAAAWKPEEIVFAFARDFSRPVLECFEKRLVVLGKASDISVTAWTLSEIVRRLDQEANEDLKLRFFGRPQESLMNALDRTIKAGGKLDRGADLLDRARSLTDYTETVDPDLPGSVLIRVHR